MEVISMKKKSKTNSWGLKGDQPSPVKNHMVLHPGTTDEKKVGMYREILKIGERFENVSAGGAGWGNPARRDPATHENDLLNGYVTPQRESQKD